jgi:RNA polymerase sigma-70 factor (ECF subfamily)
LDERSDQILTAQSRQGDKTAYEQLVLRHYRHVLGLCYAILMNFNDAQDVCQETFLRGFEKLQDLRDDSLFANWIHQIARRMCVDSLRRRKKSQSFSTLSEQPCSSDGDYSDLTTAITGLPDDYRIPLVMYYLDGHDERAIASHLGTSQSTVCRRIQTAKQLLYERLSE